MRSAAALITPAFLSGENLTNILRQVSVITIVAFGETMLIIAGMVDLAPGSVAALAGCVAIGTFISTDSVLLAVISAVLIGAASGLTSGFIITRYRVPSFIMTLAMMTVARGLVFIYTKGFPIYNIGAINFLGKGDLLGVPIPVVVMLALAIFSGVLLSKTRFGRYLYAIGGSEDAAIAARDPGRLFLCPILWRARAITWSPVGSAPLRVGMDELGSSHECEGWSCQMPTPLVF
jgi:inositol transport system permease protein